MEDVRIKTEKELGELLDRLNELEPTEQEYKTILDRTIELGKLRNEQFRIECEYESKADAVDADMLYKREQFDEEKRQAKIKNWIELGKILGSVLLLVGAVAVDNKGLFMNQSTRGIFRGLKFGIKN